MSCAKTYYIHPSGLKHDKVGQPVGGKQPHSLELWSRKDYPYMGVNVPFKVICVKDIDKVIERAAKAICRNRGCRWHGKPWDPATKINQDAWRAEARAAYRAGGFIE